MGLEGEADGILKWIRKAINYGYCFSKSNKGLIGYN
jgi:hypothetical protein